MLAPHAPPAHQRDHETDHDGAGSVPSAKVAQEMRDDSDYNDEDTNCEQQLCRETRLGAHDPRRPDFFDVACGLAPGTGAGCAG